MAVYIVDEPGTLFDATDRRREFEEREFRVCCKYCSLKATSPQRNLQNAGWRLTRQYEICPECVIELAYQATIRESIFV